MAVRVRLTRVGAKKNAMWRVVVADQRSPRDGRFIEMIGHYNPQTEPSQIVIDRERLDHWLKLGARPTETVRKLMRAENSAPLSTAAPPAPEPAAASAPAGSEAAPTASDAEPAAEPESEATEPDQTSAADESSAATEGSDGEAGTEAEASGGEEAADEKSG